MEGREARMDLPVVSEQGEEEKVIWKAKTSWKSCTTWRPSPTGTTSTEKGSGWIAATLSRSLWIALTTSQNYWNKYSSSKPNATANVTSSAPVRRCCRSTRKRLSRDTGRGRRRRKLRGTRELKR